MKLNNKPFAWVLAMTALCGQAHAADVAGNTNGVWANAQPNTPAVSPWSVGLGTSTFNWGDPAAFGTGPNMLQFAPVAAFSSDFETPFKVGTVTYFNGTTAIGSVASSVDLSLALNFTSPAIPAVVGSYTFDLISTDNTSDPDASADFVKLPSAFSATDFVIGTTTYHVKLTGFQDVVGDGFLVSDPLQFHVREGGRATADLYAVVTTETPPAPEPETYALMALGLAAVGATVRRRSAS